MTIETETASGAPRTYTRPLAIPPPVRDPAVAITELLRPRAAPTRSREEQAFIDLQRGFHQ
jgi:hypothetical protein